jgi:hypothetical protein
LNEIGYGRFVGVFEGMWSCHSGDTVKRVGEYCERELKEGGTDVGYYYC